MKLKNIVVRALFILWIFICWGCKDDVLSDDSVPPPSLVNVHVANVPGGVEMTYNELQDKNVMLITAEYETDEGGREIKRFDVEQYKTGFTIMGLTTTQRLLELYTVSHSGVRSEGVFVEIEPLLSPSMVYLQDVLASIDFIAIPAGVAFNFNNSENKELTFVVEVREVDVWRDFRSFDTEDQSGLFALNDFAFTDYRTYVRYADEDNIERSSNKPGTVQALEEVELNKSTWSALLLMGDNWEGNYKGVNYEMAALWDNILPPATSPRFENKSQPLPHSFAIDLGANQELSLSKIRIYAFSNALTNAYGQYNPRTIEIWGSNDPDPDGGWNNWTKLETCVSQMPSGGPKNASDLAYIQAGEDFRFPLFTEAYRYIRFKVLDTWTIGVGETTFIRLSEVTLYGVTSD